MYKKHDRILFRTFNSAEQRFYGKTREAVILEVKGCLYTVEYLIGDMTQQLEITIREIKGKARDK